MNLKMSIFQFGMDIQDAFGMVLLLEMVFVIVTQAIFAESIFDAIRETFNPEYTMPWWTWPFLLAITAKFILFFALLWFGFIIKGFSILIKVWIILESLLDGLVLLLIIVINSVDSHGGSEILVAILLYSFYALIFLSLRFYIYAISWLAWKAAFEDPTRGLQGYGQGLRQLYLQYKGEFQRFTVILLTLEIIWNSWTLTAIDIPLEIILHLYLSDWYVYRPVTVFRIPRIVFAALVLYVVKKRKNVYLKYSWLPFLVLSIGLGVFLPIFVYLACTESQRDFFVDSAYFTEIALSIILNGALVYNILGLANVKPCNPVPFTPMNK